jgi:hypothetical protein
MRFFGPQLKDRNEAVNITAAATLIFKTENGMNGDSSSSEYFMLPFFKGYHYRRNNVNKKIYLCLIEIAFKKLVLNLLPVS